MTPGGSGTAALERARSLVGALLAARAAPPPVLDAATVELATDEGLAPCLGAKVAQGRVVVPAARREALAWEHQMCLASYVVRAHVAGIFADRCRRSGVPLAWLKGMALVQGIFAPGERSMVDVDVLVPASRWDEACRIAAGLSGAREVRLQGRDYTAAHDYVRAFSVASGVTIEVHRFVCEASLFAIDYDGSDGLFSRAIPGVSGIWQLDEGDLFLTLAAHAAKHTFELPLRSYLDGVVLLQRGRLKLDALDERAKQWGMQRAFQLWLGALRCLQAPTLVRAGATNTGTSALAALLWSRTRDASAWQRFLRLAWISDGPQPWVRHVLTRVGLRLHDVVRARRDRGRSAL